jgi:predicted transcriptional regulator YdeE
MAIAIEEINLIGLALKTKTSNLNEQAMIDCGNLWQQFIKENIASQIPGKLNEEVLAVYHNYEGDYTKPYSYFIGCKIKKGTPVPIELDSLNIPANTYQKITAKGQMPDCVANAWREIWDTDLPRAYDADFEVYNEKSADWENAEVDIYLSVKIED